VTVDPRFDAHLLKQVQCVFGPYIAGRSLDEGAATQPTKGCIKMSDAASQSGEQIRQS
jgi:hypothetical protein